MSNFEWRDDELKSALKRLKENAPERVADAMQKACLAIENSAKNKCPSNTGELRRSIQTEVKKEDADIIGIVGTNLDYAIYVHEGTGIHSRTGAGRKDVPWVYYSDRLGRFVKTDGIESTPFLEEAVNELAPSIAEYFMGVMDNA